MLPKLILTLDVHDDEEELKCGEIRAMLEVLSSSASEAPTNYGRRGNHSRIEFLKKATMKDVVYWVAES